MIGHQFRKADFRFRRKLPVADSATNSGAGIRGRISVRWTGRQQRGVCSQSRRPRQFSLFLTTGRSPWWSNFVTCTFRPFLQSNVWLFYIRFQRSFCSFSSGFFCGAATKRFDMRSRQRNWRREISLAGLRDQLLAFYCYRHWPILLREMPTAITCATPRVAERSASMLTIGKPHILSRSKTSERLVTIGIRLRRTHGVSCSIVDLPRTVATSNEDLALWSRHISWWMCRPTRLSLNGRVS